MTPKHGLTRPSLGFYDEGFDGSPLCGLVMRIMLRAAMTMAFFSAMCVCVSEREREKQSGHAHVGDVCVGALVG